MQGSPEFQIDFFWSPTGALTEPWSNPYAQPTHMDVDRIAAELESFVRSQRETPRDAQDRLGGLLATARYSGPDGPELLDRDITRAIARLPVFEELSTHAHGEPASVQQDATALLKPKNYRLAWVGRAANLSGPAAPPVRLRHGRWILLRVAHEIEKLIAASDSGDSADRPTRAFTWISYDMRLEIDETDHRVHRVRRDVVARFDVPDQRTLTLRHYYNPPHVEPIVTLLDRSQTWLRRLPEPINTDPSWYIHVIDLGKRYGVGDMVRIRTVEEYVDKRREVTRTSPLSLRIAFVSSETRSAKLGIRIPRSLAKQAYANFGLTRANGTEDVDDRPCEQKVSKDGWARRTYNGDHCQRDRQALVELPPHFKLYD
jgi:hypothetical protein